ncbi:uncharacterized protein Z520_10383 [Fonsecaea multimorphosa CBS 102226]|uniref:Uncharacterized protein n=1 Tax=Fonsecaea multimorphosa CBS 102226 TaxID=1442371 RepID=A0A0D2IA68_9EURO|nr:uncharacterized protein Z520_10383 [Fonsecaea multimorphosa CBS 102226]KIX94046.1 hypothetical protein Z520_10383 [Fonsecaea multimorphosa CBS 102226]OAL19392.1 hypothetical protein AYO22_09936 [Fonsecaea multimorphosa]
MSQITVLGFSPSRAADQGVIGIHWAILLTPATEAQLQQQKEQQQQQPAASRPKAMSFFSGSRLLAKTGSNAAPPLETILFDMHNHQLRQQAYPVPVKVGADDAEHSTETDVAAQTPQVTTTDISSDIHNRPFRLCLRMLLSTHSLPVTKLASKVSTLLYRTPTYGPEDDWLLAALDMLVGAGILEPAQNFDSDGVLAFAGDAVKEYLSQIEQGHQREQEVLELDYLSHVRSMEQVKAMFGQQRQQVATPPYTPSQSPSPPARSPVPEAERRGSGTKSLFHHHHSSKPPKSSSSTSPTDVVYKAHKFLGLRISPSPSSYAPRHRWAAGEGMKRAYFERQDDPYGGLM